MLFKLLNKVIYYSGCNKMLYACSVYHGYLDYYHKEKRERHLEYRKAYYPGV